MINFEEMREYDREKQIEDHMRLWRGVIYKAIEDLKSGDLLTRSQARLWLLEDRRDYYDVCDLAGFDAAALRNHIKEELSVR